MMQKKLFSEYSHLRRSLDEKRLCFDIFFQQLVLLYKTPLLTHSPSMSHQVTNLHSRQFCLVRIEFKKREEFKLHDNKEDDKTRHYLSGKLAL